MSWNKKIRLQNKSNKKATRVWNLNKCFNLMHMKLSDVRKLSGVAYIWKTQRKRIKYKREIKTERERDRIINKSFIET
jgi:hypothetical protein